MEFYSIKFNTSCSLFHNDDQLYSSRVGGNIVLTDEFDEEHIIGNTELVLLHHEKWYNQAYNGKASDTWFDVWDMESLYEYHQALFGSGGFDKEGNIEWNDIVTKECEYDCGDVLVIEKMEINKEHRGKKLGLLAILYAIETFGHQKLTLLCASPLNCHDLPERARQAGISKLMKYYEQIGFMPVSDGSNYMFRGCSKIYPGISDILQSSLA